MNAPRPRLLALRAYFYVNRHIGWAALLAGFLCMAGALSWSLLIPYQHAELAHQEQESKRLQLLLKTTQDNPAAVRLPPADERAENFYTALGNRDSVENQLKILFSIADSTGLSLNQAEYKASFDKNGNFYSYQIHLPVKASYSSIRRFCELSLLTVPYASLDEMSFKREAVSKGGLEAKLRLTLYLSDKPFLAPDAPGLKTIAEMRS